MNLRANSSTVGISFRLGTTASAARARSGGSTWSMCARSADSAASFVSVAGVPVMRVRVPSGNATHFR